MQAEAEPSPTHENYDDDQTTEPYDGPVAALGGYRVADDDDDDPVLLNSDGTPVDTWREDYPYDERMPRARVRPPEAAAADRAAQAAELVSRTPASGW